MYLGKPSLQVKRLRGSITESRHLISTTPYNNYNTRFRLPRTALSIDPCSCLTFSGQKATTQATVPRPPVPPATEIRFQASSQSPIPEKHTGTRSRSTHRKPTTQACVAVRLCAFCTVPPRRCCDRTRGQQQGQNHGDPALRDLHFIHTVQTNSPLEHIRTAVSPSLVTLSQPPRSL